MRVNLCKIPFQYDYVNFVHMIFVVPTRRFNLTDDEIPTKFTQKCVTEEKFVRIVYWVESTFYFQSISILTNIVHYFYILI